MQFGYTILYVPDVPATLKFYEAAFGLTTRFVHECGDYGELETGSTALAFVSHRLPAPQRPALKLRCAPLTCPPRWNAPLPPGPRPCARWR